MTANEFCNRVDLWGMNASYRDIMIRGRIPDFVTVANYFRGIGIELNQSTVEKFRDEILSAVERAIEDFEP